MSDNGKLAEENERLRALCSDLLTLLDRIEQIAHDNKDPAISVLAEGRFGVLRKYGTVERGQRITRIVQ